MFGFVLGGIPSGRGQLLATLAVKNQGCTSKRPFKGYRLTLGFAALPLLGVMLLHLVLQE
jgi:hypothetical protein